MTSRVGQPSRCIALRIRSPRAKAERELGSKFDMRAFNDAVIRNGRLPQFVSQASPDTAASGETR